MSWSPPASLSCPPSLGPLHPPPPLPDLAGPSGARPPRRPWPRPATGSSPGRTCRRRGGRGGASEGARCSVFPRLPGTTGESDCQTARYDPVFDCAVSFGRSAGPGVVLNNGSCWGGNPNWQSQTGRRVWDRVEPDPLLRPAACVSLE